MPTIEELTTDQQAHRRYLLGQLVDDWHREKHGDYADYYAEFFETYFGDNQQQEESLVDCSLIPRYASVRSDETYGFVEVWETLPEAMAAVVQNVGEEYLNNPTGVYDLDREDLVEIPTVTVTMSADAFTIICGAVAPSSEDINVGGIYNGAWPEVQALFPVSTFRSWAEAHPYTDEDDIEDYYDEDAGL